MKTFSIRQPIPKDIRGELMTNGIKLASWSEDVLQQLTLSSNNTDLLGITVVELGFPHGTFLDNIHREGFKKGLKLCPPDACAFLLLACRNELEDGWTVAAMKQILDSGGHRGIFKIEIDYGDAWLNADKGYPSSFWGANNMFIFSK